jgi:hypothetical protein
MNIEHWVARGWAFHFTPYAHERVAGHGLPFKLREGWMRIEACRAGVPPIIAESRIDAAASTCSAAWETVLASLTTWSLSLGNTWDSVLARGGDAEGG